jgi:hypothetical protein
MRYRLTVETVEWRKTRPNEPNKMRLIVAGVEQGVPAWVQIAGGVPALGGGGVEAKHRIVLENTLL